MNYPDYAPKDRLHRIPFIANCPSAVNKIQTYKTFAIPTRGQDQFWYSFAPEACSFNSEVGRSPYPFVYSFAGPDANGKPLSSIDIPIDAAHVIDRKEL